MSESNNKILKAEIGKIKSSDLELFKNVLIPFNGSVEDYNEENEIAVVQFKTGIEKKHLEGLGNYIVKPILLAPVIFVLLSLLILSSIF